MPGWDCHGLPIEWKIEEKYRKKGKNKDDIPISEFRRECREFADHWINVQRQEFKRLGIEGDWEKLTGYKKEEILKMENIIGKIMEVENVNEYLTRLHPVGLSEASYKGYWLFKHKNGNKFKISGKTWIDYNENTFKSAFSVANK